MQKNANRTHAMQHDNFPGGRRHWAQRWGVCATRRGALLLFLTLCQRQQRGRSPAQGNGNSYAHLCSCWGLPAQKRQSHREVPPRSLFLPPHLPLCTLLSTLCGAVDNRLRAQPPPLTPLASQFIDRIMRRSREKGKNKSKRNCVKMRRVRGPSP